MLLDSSEIPFAEKLETLVNRYYRPYPSLLSLELRTEEKEIEFVPGQYLTIRFHGTPRPYSIASSPSCERIRICIRRVPGGHLTLDLFKHVESGDEVTIRGPNGDFVLKEPSPRDMVYLASAASTLNC